MIRAALLAAIILVGHAQLLHAPTRLRVALHRAELYWHAKPSCHLTVGYGDLRGGEDGYELTSYRYLPGSVGFTSDCRITIIRGLSWQQFCVVVVHEYGHALGHQHSRDPRSVMFPHTSALNAPQVCRHPA